MRKLTTIIGAATLMALSTKPVPATELIINLLGSEPIKRVTARLQCDENATGLGLPAGPFTVEYLNGAGNSLAVLPIHGQSLIFANVPSASGARYAAGPYVWWDAAGRSITLYSDSLAGKRQTSCRALS